MESAKRAAIAYTHSESFIPLLHQLGKRGVKLVIFNKSCPELKEKNMKIIKEAEILIHAVDIKYTEEWKEVERFKPDVCAFLNLNVCPDSTDADFYALCKTELRERELKDCLILFGMNFRGLLAATVYGNYFNVGDSLHVVSSVYYSSIQVFGEGDPNVMCRAIVKPEGDIFLKEGEGEELHPKIEILRGMWEFGEFAMIEYSALYSAIDEFFTLGHIQSCEMTGRFPSIDEQNKLDLTELYCTWLPSSPDIKLKEKFYLKNLRLISKKVEEIAEAFAIDLSGSENEEEEESEIG